MQRQGATSEHASHLLTFSSTFASVLSGSARVPASAVLRSDHVRSENAERRCLFYYVGITITNKHDRVNRQSGIIGYHEKAVIMHRDEEKTSQVFPMIRLTRPS